MGAMPEMRGNGTIEARGGGRYVVSYPLAMDGDWYLALAIDAPGHAHQEVKMKVATTRPGLSVEDAGGGGRTIVVSAERRQLIGVTFGTVERRPLALTLRAAGRVEIDERNLGDVTLKYEAYVQKLFVAETGKTVRRGQPLAVVYSPDLLAAEEELLAARRAGASASLTSGLERRLASWDLSVAQREAVERAGKADGRVTISAPTGGVVMEKNVVEGGRVEAGTSLYRIGNLGRVWIQCAVYERDAAFVSVGQPARVQVPSLPGAARGPRDVRGADGRRKDAHHRGAAGAQEPPAGAQAGDVRGRRHRGAARNAPGGPRLRPAASPASTATPSSTAAAGGSSRWRWRSAPRPAATTRSARGLSPGDRVATGATFLLSSEAKLRDALPRWRTP